jgi:hypothetical protein
MDEIVTAEIYAPLLAIGMVLTLELGRRYGARRAEGAGFAGGKVEGISGIEGSIFGLFGLLLAFTFYGSAARFDARRQLIAQEANAVSTAYLRVDMLRPQAQPAMRDLFRQYLDSRLATYRKVPDLEAVRAEMATTARLQQEIWRRAEAETSQPQPGMHPNTGMLLLQGLNAMFDISTTRTMAARLHPPRVIYLLLATLALLCSLLAGHAMGASQVRSHFHQVIFAVIVAITVYTVLEIEYPRLGWLRIDPYEQVLIDLRASMR